MRYILENDTLRVEIESFGAEIKSVKRKADGREYMWCGDPKYWGRTSPVLFPFVGAPKNKEYRYEGRTYPMGQHGFARDMEFTLEAQEGKSIWFVLSSTEETYAKYPFRFRLHIGYMLDENEVSVHWKVDNTDEKPMYFSTGATSWHFVARSTGNRIRRGIVSGSEILPTDCIITATRRTAWQS